MGFPKFLAAAVFLACATLAYALTPAQGDAIARAALSKLGAPYQWGGKTFSPGIDCSGLTTYAYAGAGISLPHGSANQAAWVRTCSMQRGSLLFFRDSPMPGPITHVGISLGDGTMVHANQLAGKVRVDPIGPYWRDRLVMAATR